MVRAFCLCDVLPLDYYSPNCIQALNRPLSVMNVHSNCGHMPAPISSNSLYKFPIYLYLNHHFAQKDALIFHKSFVRNENKPKERNRERKKRTQWENTIISILFLLKCYNWINGLSCLHIIKMVAFFIFRVNQIVVNLVGNKKKSNETTLSIFQVLVFGEVPAQHFIHLFLFIFFSIHSTNCNERNCCVIILMISWLIVSLQ